MGLNKIKEWQLDLSETHAKIEALGKAVTFKGRVDSVDQLPELGEDGDFWYVGPVESENKSEYIWFDGKFELLGTTSREDYNSLHNDLDELGDQVAEIESKIPEGTSDTNPLVNKQQLFDAIQSGGSVPDNVYTEENLIGGKDIEIVPEPVEGGIDEHTLSCFHLDENTEDVVTGYVPPNVTIDNTLHKFGTGSTMWVNSTSFPWSLNSSESFSFDFWIYRKSDRSAALGLGTVAGSPSCHIRLFAGNYPIQFSIHGLSKETGVYVDNNTWSHIYVYYNADDRSYHLFLNGKEIYSEVNTKDFSNLNNFASDGYTTSRFDEIRISKCIRWTEDFEPPTQPYRKAEPTGNYVVNFTGEASGSNASFPLFHHTFADHILNDASWLRADTFSWQSGDMYVSAYNHLVADIEGLTAEVETIGSTEITFYRANDGHKIVLADQEDKVSAIYRATGVAWYYILDTKNKRFKLPRTKWAFTGLRNCVGSFVEAGLPNHYHLFGYNNANNAGSFVATNNNVSIKQATESGISFGYRGWNGSGGGGGFVSSPIEYAGNMVTTVGKETKSFDGTTFGTYGNSDTVQPPATEQYLYFYVGNTVRNQTEVDIGAVTEQLNGKQDVLGNNVDYVVESYNDDTNWYRVYKSGWLEQGGKLTFADATSANVVFLKPFADTKYTWTQGQMTKNFSQAQFFNGWGLSSYSATGFTVYSATNGTNEIAWIACGQGA